MTSTALSGVDSTDTTKTGTLVAGDKVKVVLTMSEATSVTGTPTFSIDVGGATKTASYASGSGTTSLTFYYTVAAGDTDSTGGITAPANALALAGGSLKDAAGNDATLATSAISAGTNSIVINATSNSGSDNSYTPGQAVIDLGTYGKLIHPVQVDGGRWFYYWDRSGDGTSSDVGALNGGSDIASQSAAWELPLGYIFNKDVNLFANPFGLNVDSTYRFALLNGVKVAIPTFGDSTLVEKPGTTGNYVDWESVSAKQTTAVGSTVAASGSNAVNPAYDDLLAIWDAYNGTAIGPGAGVAGTPPGWRAGLYISASRIPDGHIALPLATGGGVLAGSPWAQFWTGYSSVALEVLGIDTTAPTIAIAGNKTSLKTGETATITFTLSESSTDFTVADLTVLGGTVSNFAVSGANYTATFTPTANSTTNGLVSVASGRFSDAAGNFNADGSDANNTVTFTVDTRTQTNSNTTPSTPICFLKGTNVSLKAGDLPVEALST
ncbi:MAG: hypothetical protein EB072_06790, partial [Betaproteobacteria bacterium]|nr:hypothetical protein [Betaproteobacteria bacterium]